MANIQRGEVTVTLGGRDYVLRPTFAALAEIESLAGRGLVPLAQRFLDRQFGLADVLAVLGPAIKAGGSKPPENLGDAVVAAGVLNLAGPIARFLAHALSGDAIAGEPDGAPRQPGG
jgi:Phage tail tube protein, GTA-gp10